MVGGVCAGVYTSSSANEAACIINHCEAKLLVVDSAAQLKKVRALWSEMPLLGYIVMMKGADIPEGDKRILSWEDFLAQAETVADSSLDERLRSLRADQVADFIYTSGSTGAPKAVMLTHENLTWTADVLADVLSIHSETVTLSYLPLSHIAEQTVSVMIMTSQGYTVYYCDNTLKLADYIKEVRPTFFFGVPRVYERIASALSARLAKATGEEAEQIERAREVGTRVTLLRNRGEAVDEALSQSYERAHTALFSDLRRAVGFDRTETFVTGAAPTPVAIIDFFASIGISLHELYGQSEGSSSTSSNLPGRTKFGSVGPALPGVEVKIAEDGEILLRGKNVFPGYYKDRAATDATLIGGWLHSGDLGQFDDDGFLHIEGRKKDIIITSGGKNVAPKNIEGALTALELVSSAVCVGEGRRYLIALLTLEPVAAASFAEQHHLSVEDLPSHPLLRDALAKDIAEVNAQFARVEHIRNFVVLPNTFSVETGDLTPTFKIRRAAVNRMYAAEIEDVYSEGQLL